MRRFSQRNSLVTLNEINITPLLDLAFVLLIIFIIVSGSIQMEQSVDLKLPQGGGVMRQVEAKDLRTISVTRQGQFYLGKRILPLPAIMQELVAERRLNPNIVVSIRLDQDGVNKHTVALIDQLKKHQIQDVHFATEAGERK
jgi:biopolymer transport protein ExbD